MRKIKYRFLIIQILLLFLIHLFVINMEAARAAGSIEEYTLKAVYIDKITRFVQWPEKSKIPDTSKPFVIGIYGETPFESALRDIYKDHKIKNKKVIIIQISKIEKISGCHILFISKVNENELLEILAFTKNRSILTISDSDNFANIGVHINFYLKENKVRFEINEKATKESGLAVSYLLMQVAKIVNPIKEDKK